MCLRNTTSDAPEILGVNSLYSKLQEQARELEQAKKLADKYWDDLCRTVEALGKIAPEAAIDAPGWAADMRHQRNLLIAVLREINTEAPHPLAETMLRRYAGVIMNDSFIQADIEAAHLMEMAKLR